MVIPEVHYRVEGDNSDLSLGIDMLNLHEICN